MAIYQGHNEDSSGNLLLSIGNGMTATVETGSTASQAYTKGSYLFFNNRLCKAASAIASGATLTIGGNLTQTSLGAEITSHLRSSDGKEFYFDVKNGQYGYYPSASKTASEFVPFGGTQFDCLFYADTSGVGHLTDFTGSSWTMQSKDIYSSQKTFTLQNGKVITAHFVQTSTVRISISQAGTLYDFGNQNKGGLSPTISQVDCGSSGGYIESDKYSASIFAVKFS